MDATLDTNVYTRQAIEGMAIVLSQSDSMRGRKDFLVVTYIVTAIIKRIVFLNRKAGNTPPRQP